VGMPTTRLGKSPGTIARTTRMRWTLAVLGMLATQAVADDATRDAPPAKDGSVGTAAPLGGFIGSDDGRWAILCQARVDTDGNGRLETTYDIHHTGGDTLEPYLVLGTGAGMAIDYQAARSEHGEWLAVVRGGKLELIQSATYQRWQLTADLRHDKFHRGDDKAVRFASIAANGSRMTYLREKEIVIRDLKTHAEQVVPVKDKLWRATVDGAGRWAKVRVIRKDTNRDGKVDWPGGHGAGFQYRCGADNVHHHNPMDGDAVVELWLDLATGKLVEDATVIDVVGEELLRRRKDGALVLGGTVLVEAWCKAQVVATLAVPPRVAVACNAKEDELHEKPTLVLGPGFRRQAAHGYRTPYWFYRGNGRFLYREEHVLDLALGEELALGGSKVRHVDHLALVKTKSGYAIFDALKRTTRTLAATGDVESYNTDALVTIGGATYDLRSAAKLAPPGRILHTDAKGRVLVQPTQTAVPGRFGIGPLRWWTP
jgi:hypothetical protein